MPLTGSATDFQSPDQSLGMQALRNVLSSSTFADMPRLQRFLEYVVTETIAGRGNRLKGVVIACEVFDKTDPDDAQSTTIVRVEAGRLRRRLSDYYRDEGRLDPIQILIPKGGYTAVFEEQAKDSTKPDLTQDQIETTSHPLTKRNFIVLIVILLSLLAVVITWNRITTNTGGVLSDQIVNLIDTKPIIAVLPFNNRVSNDPDDSVAFGLTEDIITDLGRLSKLEVISMSSVLPFKEQEITPQEIGAKLGVKYVLQGSVRGTSPNLRVTAQLYDTNNGVQLWAERFDRQMANKLTLQAELARQVVQGLSISLQDSEAMRLGQQTSTDHETWYLYKQAMNLVNPPSDPARLALGLQVFEQIIERDPDFAGGYAGMAYIHAFMAFWGHSQSPDKDIQLTLDIAQKAQSLDPFFGLSYSAQAFAFLVNRDFKQALTTSGKAVQIAPNDPYVMVYHGFILSANGQHDEGIFFAERALRLDPLYARTPYLNILGVINLQARHYPTALKAFHKSQERGGPLGPGIYNFLAATYAALGNNEKATSTLAMADLLKKGNNAWEAWVKRSWEHQEDSEHVLNLIEQIRRDDQPQD